MGLECEYFLLLSVAWNVLFAYYFSTGIILCVWMSAYFIAYYKIVLSYIKFSNFFVTKVLKNKYLGFKFIL